MDDNERIGALEMEAVRRLRARTQEAEILADMKRQIMQLLADNDRLAARVDKLSYEIRKLKSDRT